jgi:hypothetical protein
MIEDIISRISKVKTAIPDFSPDIIYIDPTYLKELRTEMDKSPTMNQDILTILGMLKIETPLQDGKRALILDRMTNQGFYI